MVSTNVSNARFDILATDANGFALSRVYSPPASTSGTQTLTLPLQPGKTHNLTVTLRADLQCVNPDGTPAYILQTGAARTVDKNGQPLTIVQQSTTAYPTSTMIAPLTISGKVTLNSATGAGIAGVLIYHQAGLSAEAKVTTTDANGFYSFNVDTQGYQETHTIRPEKAGMQFTPISTWFS